MSYFICSVIGLVFADMLWFLLNIKWYIFARNKKPITVFIFRTWNSHESSTGSQMSRRTTCCLRHIFDLSFLTHWGRVAHICVHTIFIFFKPNWISIFNLGIFKFQTRPLFHIVLLLRDMIHMHDRFRYERSAILNNTHCKVYDAKADFPIWPDWLVLVLMFMFTKLGFKIHINHHGFQNGFLLTGEDPSIIFSE